MAWPSPGHCSHWGKGCELLNGSLSVSVILLFKQILKRNLGSISKKKVNVKMKFKDKIISVYFVKSKHSFVHFQELSEDPSQVS